jgi:cytochrome c5
MMKIKKIICTATLLLAGPAFAGSGVDIYENACISCHGSGFMGAPETGDKDAWAPRVAQGRKMLFEHTKYGFNGMPARGGNDSLSDKELTAALDYMINQVGGYPAKHKK